MIHSKQEIIDRTVQILEREVSRFSKAKEKPGDGRPSLFEDLQALKRLSMLDWSGEPTEQEKAGLMWLEDLFDFGSSRLTEERYDHIFKHARVHLQDLLDGLTQKRDRQVNRRVVNKKYEDNLIKVTSNQEVV